MYDIEDRARELPADSRCELRCAEANPVLDRLEAYLAQLATTLLPKSALAKAVMERFSAASSVGSSSPL
jgi:hypothetical protein